MKKKFLMLAIAASVGCCQLSGCGDSSSKDDSDGSKSDGNYYSVNGVPIDKEDWTDDFDSALDALKSSDNYSCIVIEDDTFTISNVSGNSIEQTYTGAVKISNSKIKFDYQKYAAINQKGNEIIVGIDDEKEDLNRAERTYLQNMEALNESGTYIDIVKPALYCYDKMVDYGVLPIFITSNMNVKRVSPVILECKDDFLCVDVYGMELNGKYKHGEDFTIDFNVLSPFTDDEYSYTNISEDDDYLEKMKQRLEKYIFCGDDFDTTIEFSDGEWEWYNSDGDLINNGEYQESKKYKGLIEMYATENSEKYSRIYNEIAPLFFYIDNDGNIYYPGFIKG